MSKKNSNYTPVNYDRLAFTSKPVSTAGEIKQNSWAKSYPYKTIMDHMYETGITGQMLCEHGNFRPFAQKMANITNASIGNILNFIGFVCAVHDIGKMHLYFQDREVEEEPPAIRNFREMIRDRGLQEELEDNYRHEKNIQIIRKTLNELDIPIGRQIEDIVSMHHQGKKNNPPEDLEHSEWEEAQKQAVREMYEYFPFEPFKTENNNLLSHLMLSILIFADWTASNENLYGDISRNAYDSREAYTAGIESRMWRFLSDNNMLYKPCSPHSMKDIFPFIEDMHPFQKTADKIAAEYKDNIAFALIEAPCGEGKTETALTLAASADTTKSGIYMGLPTNATAEGIISRVNDALLNLEMPKASLFTSSRDTNRANMGETYFNAWHLPRRQSIFQSNAVGTVDQAMLSSIKSKYCHLRFGGVMTKAIIIDEIHAYDSFMLKIIETMTKNAVMCDAPVIMLSATLPTYTKERLISAVTGEEPSLKKGYPQITIVTKDNQVKQFNADFGSELKNIGYELIDIMGQYKEIGENVLAKIKNGGCACVVSNTVNSAINTYTEIKEHCDADTEVYLIHGRKTITDKGKDTEKLLKLFGKDRTHRPKKAVVVATQIVEQSLDVDFDFMFTEICPIDLLIQRTGRMHRHSDKGTVRENIKIAEPLTVFLPFGAGYNNSEHIYQTATLEKTIELLKAKRSLNIPEGNIGYVDNVYTEDVILKGNTAKTMSASIVTMPIDNQQRFSYTENSIKGIEEKTRLGMERVNVGIVTEEEYDKLKNNDDEYRLAVQISNNKLVSIPKYTAEELVEGNNVYECEKYFYGKTYLLKETKTGVFVTDDLTVTYDSIFGMVFHS